MPIPVNVLTLKQTCLRNISRNMDKLWSVDFDRYFADMPRLYYVLGPFDYFTPEMIQELLNNLTANRRLRRTHLHLLLTTRLDELDFSRCPSMTSMLHLVGIRCQRLMKLNLNNCSTATPSLLCSVLQNLPHLRWLNLRQTKANDQVLATILSSCTKLQHLNMFACPVTDRGVANIYEALTNGNKGILNGQKGSSLLFLDINATKIGSKGAVMILKMIPSIHVLQYADVIDAVAQLCTGDTNQGEMKLRTLTATGIKCKDISAESVQLACIHCPYVTEVLFYQTARDSSLQCLKLLPNLSTLEITSDQWGDVTFFDGLKPLFQEIGPKILSLGLYDIKDLDIGQLGVLCPNLTRLKVVMAVFNSVAFVETPLLGKDQRLIYKNLRNLTLVIGSDATNFVEFSFLLMLQNAVNLSEVHLINIQCLSTPMLVSVIEKHGFEHLSSVDLEFCNHITATAISRLLACDNPLTYLRLSKCHEITRQDVDGFGQYVKSNNLNLSIVWD